MSVFFSVGRLEAIFLGRSILLSFNEEEEEEEEAGLAAAVVEEN